MKNPSLISKIAITGLAAMAISTASYHVQAADLVWDKVAGTYTWNLSDTTLWSPAQAFQNGDNITFNKNIGLLNIAVDTLQTGLFKIHADLGDVYTFTNSNASDKIWFTQNVDIDVGSGGVVKLHHFGKGAGSKNNDLDITMNLIGTGEVHFTGSTSSFEGSGKVVVGSGVTLIAGDPSQSGGTYSGGTGGITNATIENSGKIQFYRGQGSAASPGVYDFNGKINGDGIVEKYLKDTMRVTRGEGLGYWTKIHIKEGTVYAVNSDWIIHGGYYTLYPDATLDVNGHWSKVNSLTGTGGTVTKSEGDWSNIQVLGSSDLRNITFKDTGSSCSLSLKLGGDSGVQTYEMGKASVTNNFSGEVQVDNNAVLNVYASTGALGKGYLAANENASVNLLEDNITLSNNEIRLYNNSKFSIRGKNADFTTVTKWNLTQNAGIYVYENVAIAGEVNIEHNENSFFVDTGKTMTLTGYLHNGGNNWDPVRKKGAGDIVIGSGARSLWLYHVQEGSVIVKNGADFRSGKQLDGWPNNINFTIESGTTMDVSDWNIGNGNLIFDGNRDGDKTTFANIDNKGTFKGNIEITANPSHTAAVINMANLIGNMTVSGGTLNNIGAVTGNVTISGGTVNGKIGSVSGLLTISGGTSAIDVIGGLGSLHLTEEGHWTVNSETTNVTGAATIDGGTMVINETVKAGNRLFRAGSLAYTSGAINGLSERQIFSGLTMGTGADAGWVLLQLSQDVNDLIWKWDNTDANPNIWNTTGKTWTNTSAVFINEDRVSFDNSGGAKIITVQEAGVLVNELEVDTLAASNYRFEGGSIDVNGSIIIGGAGTVSFAGLSGKVLTLDGANLKSSKQVQVSIEAILNAGGLEASLVAPSITKATTGVLALNKTDALKDQTLDFQAGSITANAASAFNNSNLKMTAGTSLELNGFSQKFYQIEGNGSIGNSSADLATVFISNNGSNRKDLDLSNIALDGNLQLRYESYGQDIGGITINRTNTFTGGSIFESTNNFALSLGASNALGTGLAQIGANSVYITQTSSFSNPIEFLRADSDGGGYIHVHVTDGKTITFDDNIQRNEQRGALVFNGTGSDRDTTILIFNGTDNYFGGDNSGMYARNMTMETSTGFGNTYMRLQGNFGLRITASITIDADFQTWGATPKFDIGANDVIFTGRFEGGEGYDKYGTGTMILAQNPKVGGGGEIRVKEGALQFGQNDTTGMREQNANVASGTKVIFWHGVDFTMQPFVSGAGDLEKKGAGTMLLARNFDLTGAVILTEGNVIFGDGHVAKYNVKYNMSPSGYMENFGKAIQTSSGTNLILDYASHDTGLTRGVTTPVYGTGNLVIGAMVESDKPTYVYTLKNDKVTGALYSGSTTITSYNTLVISDGIVDASHFASTSIKIAENAEFKYGDSGTKTFATATSFSSKGIFSGNLTLTSAAASVNGLGTSISGNVIISGGVDATVNANQTTGILTVGGTLDLSGINTLRLKLVDNSHYDSISVAGALTASGTQKLVLTTGESGLLDGVYNVITHTGGSIAAGVFTHDYRAGVVTVDSTTAGLVKVTVNSGFVGDLIWNGSASPGNGWNTLTTNTNWAGTQSFYTGDNVTFDASAVEKAVAVDAAGVFAGNMTVSASGYTFTGGNITGGKLTANDNVSFGNAGIHFAAIEVLAGKTLTLNLAADSLIDSKLLGGGNMDKSGAGKLSINADTSAFTGKLILNAGLLDVLNAATVAMDLNGGTLTSSGNNEVKAAITVTSAGSVIDLTGGKLASDTYRKWTAVIDNSGGLGMTLKNGMLDNTEGKVVGSGSNAEAALGIVGTALIAQDLTISNATINRGIKAYSDTGRINVNGTVTFATYATIDLSEHDLTLDVASGATATAKNFLTGDKTLIKEGLGILDISNLTEGGSHAAMSFTGEIIVNGGTLLFNRGNYDNSAFDNNTAKITINSGASLITTDWRGFGRNPNSMPTIEINDGTLKVKADTPIRELILTNALVDGYDSGNIRAVIDGDGASKIYVKGGESVLTKNLVMREGNWDIDVASGATFRVTRQLEGGGDTSRKLNIHGGGTVIFTDNPWDTQNLQMSIGANTTVEIGDKNTFAILGGLQSATVKNEGVLGYYRGGDYDFTVKMSGTGSLIKSGSGQMYIKAVQTYTGLTTIEDGSIRLSQGSGGAFVGDLLIKSGTMLNLDSYAGSGGYIVQKKSGDGWSTTQQRFDVNAGGTIKNHIIVAEGGILNSDGFTDSVDVNAGGKISGLHFGNTSGTGAITIDQGGVFVVGSLTSGTIDVTQIDGNVSLKNGSILTMDIDNSGTGASDSISYSGSLTLAGVIKLDLINVNSLATDADGDYILATGYNAYTATQLKSFFKFGRATLDFTQSDETQIKVTITDSQALNLTWDGTSANKIWSNDAETNNVWKKTDNTNIYFVNGDSVTFNTSAGSKAVEVDTAGVVANAMTVIGADAYTFTGGQIQTTGALTIGDAGAKAKAIFNNTSNNSFASVSLVNDAAMVFGASQTAATYAIGGAGSIEKTGGGTLVLSGINTYTGGTTVSGNSTVQVTDQSNLGGSGNAKVTLDGGTLKTTGAATLDNVLVKTNGGNINAGAAMTVTLDGASTGALTTDGSITAQSNLSWKNDLTINSGTFTANTAQIKTLKGAGTFDGNSTALKVQSGDFSGSLNNVSALTVGAVDSSGSKRFKRIGSAITINTTVESGYTLEANVTLGTGQTLAAGNTGSDTGASIVGNVNLDNATLVTAGTGTIGKLEITGDLSLKGTTLSTSFDNTEKTIDKIVVSGQVALDTGNKTTISFENDGVFGDNTYQLLQYGSLSGVTEATVADAFKIWGISRKDLSYTAENNVISFTVIANPALLVWDNGTSNGMWDGTSSNWDTTETPDTFVAGDNVKFTDTAAGAVNVASGMVAGIMTVDNTTAGNYTFTGSAITAEQLIKQGNGKMTLNVAGNEFTDGILIRDGSVVIGVDNALKSTTEVSFNDAATTAGATLDVNGKTVSIGKLDGAGKGTVALGSAGNLSVASGNYTGKVTGGSASNLTKTGSGTLVLGGLNTTDFQGALTVNGGNVNLTGNNAVNTLNSALGTSIVLGGNLTVNGGTSDGNISGTGNLDVGGNFSLGGNNTFSGSLNVNAGTTTLASATAITANTNVNVANGATIDLNGNNITAKNLNAAAGSTVALSNNATLNANADTDAVIAGNITDGSTGSGKFVKDGTGTLTLSGNNTFSGGISVNKGTVAIANASNLGAGTVTLANGGILSMNGSVVANNSFTFSAGQGTITTASGTNSSIGDIAGAGTLIKSGDGNLNIAGTNSGFTGGLNITGGTLSSSNALTVAALGGTGTWNLVSDGTVNNNGTSTFGGSFEGGSMLTKKGTGDLVLSGDSSNYSGMTSLENGRTLINGDFGDGSNTLYVRNGATLGGNGNIQANVIVETGGKVSPGNSIGTLTITGNQTMQNDSLLGIEVSTVADSSLTGISVSDRIDVSGSFTGDAFTINLLKESAGNNFVEDSYRFLIVSAGSMVLNIDNVTLSSTDLLFTEDYTTVLSQEGNNLYLTMNINRPDYSQYVDGENQSAVASYLDADWNNADTFWKKTVAKEVRLNPLQASNFLDQLSGYTLAHAMQSRELAGEHFRQLWSQRLMTGQAAQTSLDKATVNINPTEGASIAKFKNAESNLKESYWAQPFTYDTNMASENHVKGYDYRANGITAGFDTRFDTNMVVGAAFFYEDGTVDVKRSSDKSNIDDTRFAVYGGWEEEDISLIASASYGIQQYESKRYVNIGSLGGTSKSDYDGSTYGASIDATMKLRGGFRAFAGFDWLNVSRDGFTEKGSDFAMKVSKEDHDMLASRLGVRYDRYFGNFGLYGLAAWKHRFDDTESSIKGAYAGMNGSFTAHGLSNDPDSALLGLGGEYNITPNYSVFGDVNADLNSDHTELGFSAGLRYTW